MATVAVTGAAGFIGSAVVRQLLAAKRDVRAILEPRGPDQGGSAGAGNDRNLIGLDVERVTCDVTDLAAMKRALSGCETLYHLAAIYRTWLPDHEIIYRVNLEGTTTTLLAAQAAKVRRIVYTSSIAAVGLVAGGEADESTPWNLFDVANPYILTKWQSERTAMRFAEAGMPIVVVNPAFPFGPRDVAPTPTGKIVLAVLNGKLPALGPGGICAIDVDDCATGHLLAEEKGRVGERFILGAHNVSMNDLFRLIGKVGGVKVPKLAVPGAVGAAVALGMELWADHVSHKEPVATYKALRYTQRDVFFDVGKAKRELGLQVRPLDESVARAVAWFREAGLARRGRWPSSREPAMSSR